MNNNLINNITNDYAIIWHVNCSTIGKWVSLRYDEDLVVQKFCEQVRQEFNWKGDYVIWLCGNGSRNILYEHKRPGDCDNKTLKIALQILDKNPRDLSISFITRQYYYSG